MSKLTRSVIQLADNDRQPEVREAACEALIAAYKCFGDKIVKDLHKHRPKRMSAILARFNDVIPVPQAASSVMKTARSRPTSRNELRPPMSSTRPTTTGTMARRKKIGPDGDKTGGASGAMGVTERVGEYEKNLPNLDSLDLSERGLESSIDKIHRNLQSTQTEWEDRNKELRLIRALALENCLPSGVVFRKFGPSLTQALSDLRSQVTRAACVTLGLLSSRIDAASFGQMIISGPLAQLIKLIPTTIKIMSSSASSCLTIILSECHYHKIPPTFTEQVRNSKSIQIRRSCIRFIGQICEQWTQTTIIKSNDDITQALTQALQVFAI